MKKGAYPGHLRFSSASADLFNGDNLSFSNNTDCQKSSSTRLAMLQGQHEAGGNADFFYETRETRLLSDLDFVWVRRRMLHHKPKTFLHGRLCQNDQTIVRAWSLLIWTGHQKARSALEIQDNRAKIEGQRWVGSYQSCARKPAKASMSYICKLQTIG